MKIIEKYPKLVDLPKNDLAKEALVRAVINVWEELDKGVLNKLVELIVRRLQAVINAGGWYTKYLLDSFKRSAFRLHENVVSIRFAV